MFSPVPLDLGRAEISRCFPFLTSPYGSLSPSCSGSPETEGAPGHMACLMKLVGSNVCLVACNLGYAVPYAPGTSSGVWMNCPLAPGHRIEGTYIGRLTHGKGPPAELGWITSLIHSSAVDTHLASSVSVPVRDDWCKAATVN